jgi:hypothetical protein
MEVRRVILDLEVMLDPILNYTYCSSWDTFQTLIDC